MAGIVGMAPMLMVLLWPSGRCFIKKPERQMAGCWAMQISPDASSRSLTLGQTLKCNMNTSGNLGLPQEVSGGVRLHETVCGCMRFFPIFPSDEIGNVILVGWKLNSDASQVLNGHSTKKTEEPSCNLLQTHPL